MIKIKLNIMLLVVGSFILVCCKSEKKQTEGSSSRINFDYLGIAVQKKYTHIWGSSPVLGKDGKVHLYVSEWPIPKDASERFSGWHKHCNIAHYVGDTPEGPFEFVRTAIKDQDGEFNSPHNPTIKYIDGQYVLCFIVNENNDLSKQRIMMYVADDLSDNWKPAKGAELDGTMLRVPSDTIVWNYEAVLGVSNPSLIKANDQYLLYYKSVVPLKEKTEKNKGRDYGYGVAISKNLQGPYDFYPKRVTEEGIQLEDAFAFNLGQEIAFLSRDYMAAKGSHAGGLLWRSSDGFSFPTENTTRAFEGLSAYVGEDNLKNANVFRGTKEGHLERPQLLMIDEKTIYLYLATGINTTPDFGSASHVFKVLIKNSTVK